LKMRAKVKMLLVIILVIALALLSTKVLAEDPAGPGSIERGSNERAPTADPVVVQAQAGNVTALTINATKITGRWQGYYGNITGTITLDDANNATMYSWTIASPQGEIYAVNDSTTPIWEDIVCFNFSKTSAEQNVTLSDLEAALGMAPSDADTVNKTFNHTFKGSLTVGSVTLTEGDGCQVVSLNVNDDYDAVKFNETILTDNSTKIIYTSLLEQDETGFQGSTLDFQMLVGENGDTTEATNYYFYVELS
jgi:hypothetical protein